MAIDLLASKIVTFRKNFYLLFDVIVESLCSLHFPVDDYTSINLCFSVYVVTLEIRTGASIPFFPFDYHIIS